MKKHKIKISKHFDNKILQLGSYMH